MLERRLEAVEQVLDRPWRERPGEPAMHAEPRAGPSPELRARWAAEYEAKLALYDASALTHDERLAFYYMWTHFSWQAREHWPAYIEFLQTCRESLTEKQKTLWENYLDHVAYLRVDWWRKQLHSRMGSDREANAQTLEKARVEQARKLADLEAEARGALGDAWGLIGDENREAAEAFVMKFHEARDDLDYQSTYRDVVGVWPEGRGTGLFDSALRKIIHAFCSLPEEQQRLVVPIKLRDWVFLGSLHRGNLKSS